MERRILDCCFSVVPGAVRVPGAVCSPAAADQLDATGSEPSRLAAAPRRHRPLHRRQRRNRRRRLRQPSVVGETAEREIIVDTPTRQRDACRIGVAGFCIGGSRSIATTRASRLISCRLRIPADQPTPFSLRVEDEAITRTLNNALYRVIGAIDGRFDPQTGMPLVFEFEDASGLRVRKEFRFDPATYVDSLHGLCGRKRPRV